MPTMNCPDMQSLERLLHGNGERCWHGRPFMDHLQDCSQCRARSIEVAANMKTAKTLQSLAHREQTAGSVASPFPREIGRYQVVREIGRGGMGSCTRRWTLSIPNGLRSRCSPVRIPTRISCDCSVERPMLWHACNTLPLRRSARPVARTKNTNSNAWTQHTQACGESRSQQFKTLNFRHNSSSLLFPGEKDLPNSILAGGCGIRRQP